jgi:hypothetical protein
VARGIFLAVVGALLALVSAFWFACAWVVRRPPDCPDGVVYGCPMYTWEYPPRTYVALGVAYALPALALLALGVADLVRARRPRRGGAALTAGA